MSKIKPFLDQDYETLKGEAKMSGELFVDDKFPANDSSLFRFNKFNPKIVWKRPHEIENDPKFIVNKIEPNDLDQGNLGNCWFVAAAACVLNCHDLIERTIPLNQSFDAPDYCGIFHFRFWLNGDWVDVVIDDYLPVDEKSGRLYFCHNKVEKNEMYGSLLEKAYAKLNTCYEFLINGSSREAFVNFTGGISEIFSISDFRQKSNLIDKLWETLFKALSYKSLIICSIKSEINEIETVLSNGLAKSHSYSILNLFQIIEKNGIFNELRENESEKPTRNSLKLLRIRNPWGKKNAYVGLWNKGGEEWNRVGQEAKEILEPDNQDDGQFLISFEDFIKEFDVLSLCHVNVHGFDYEETNDSDFRWKILTFKGEWIVGENAGGLDNELFWKNPQYKITIEDTKDKFTIIISLLQFSREQKKLENQGGDVIYEPIGFYIYSIIDSEAQPDQNGIYEKKSLKFYKHTKGFMPVKQISKRFDIEPGDYVVIPSFFQKDIPGSYVLRIYTETHKHCDQEEIDENSEFGIDNTSKACLLM